MKPHAFATGEFPKGWTYGERPMEFVQTFVWRRTLGPYRVEVVAEATPAPYPEPNIMWGQISLEEHQTRMMADSDAARMDSAERMIIQSLRSDIRHAQSYLDRVERDQQEQLPPEMATARTPL